MSIYLNTSNYEYLCKDYANLGQSSKLISNQRPQFKSNYVQQNTNKQDIGFSCKSCKGTKTYGALAATIGVTSALLTALCSSPIWYKTVNKLENELHSHYIIQTLSSQSNTIKYNAKVALMNVQREAVKKLEYIKQIGKHV